MALGDNYQDNNEKKYYEPIVHSAYTLRNSEGIDPSALSFSFFRGMIKIGISPKKQNTDKIAYDYDNGIYMYLTHTKAKLLLEEIKAIMQNPGTISNAGVRSGEDGLITFSDGKELGVTGPCLIMRRLDEQDKAISSYAYEFKMGYHRAIRNYNEGDASKEEYYYDNLEIDQFIMLLEEYCKAITGAFSYSVINDSRYSNSVTNTKIDSILDHLGIKQPKKGNYSKSGSSSRSIFNNSQNGNDSGSSMRKSSLDELDGSGE